MLTFALIALVGIAFAILLLRPGDVEPAVDAWERESAFTIDLFGDHDGGDD